jgi:hypothetical protein
MRGRQLLSLATSFGVAVSLSSCGPTATKQTAIRATISADPFVKRLLLLADEKLPKSGNAPIFGAVLRFPNGVPVADVGAPRDWEHPVPDRWTKSFEIVYGGGAADENQVQCFVTATVEFSEGPPTSYAEAVLLFNYPLTPSSCQ